MVGGIGRHIGGGDQGKAQFDGSGGGVEQIGGREAEILGDFAFAGNRRNWDQSEAEELVFHKILGPAQHPNLAFEDGVELGDFEGQILVEFWVLAAAIDDPGGEGLVGVVGKGEFGVDVLVVVDANVVDVPGMVDVDFEDSREVGIAVWVRIQIVTEPSRSIERIHAKTEQ